MAEPVTHIGIYYQRTHHAPFLTSEDVRNGNWATFKGTGGTVHLKDYQFHVGSRFDAEREGFRLLRTIEIPPFYREAFRSRFGAPGKMGEVTYSVADHSRDRKNPRQVAMRLHAYPKGDPAEAKAFIDSTPALGSFLELALVAHLRSEKVTHARTSIYRTPHTRSQLTGMQAEDELPLDKWEEKLKKRVADKVGASVLKFLEADSQD